jgi:hypothetical protein
MNRSTTTSTTHRPSRRQRAKAADPAQVRGIPEPMSTQISKANRPAPSPGGIPEPMSTQISKANRPTPPVGGIPEPMSSHGSKAPRPADPAGSTRPDSSGGDQEEGNGREAAELMQELGMEPAPCTPEAHALLKEAGISPKPAPGEPLGPDDERFSPIAIGHLTHRLLDVKRFLEQLTAEQKQLHETLRLAHLRGDLLHLLAPSSEGWCYQLGDGVLLTRRQGRKQWSYSPLWAELEAQLKARQTYEQATGEATWRHGAAFWDLRGMKG